MHLIMSEQNIGMLSQMISMSYIGGTISRVRDDYLSVLTIVAEASVVHCMLAP